MLSRVLQHLQASASAQSGAATQHVCASHQHPFAFAHASSSTDWTKPLSVSGTPTQLFPARGRPVVTTAARLSPPTRAKGARSMGNSSGSTFRRGDVGQLPEQRSARAAATGRSSAPSPAASSARPAPACPPARPRQPRLPGTQRGEESRARRPRRPGFAKRRGGRRRRRVGCQPVFLSQFNPAYLFDPPTRPRKARPPGSRRSGPGCVRRRRRSA